jgi:hypothetical protein
MMSMNCARLARVFSGTWRWKSSMHKRHPHAVMLFQCSFAGQLGGAVMPRLAGVDDAQQVDVIVRIVQTLR